MTPAAVLRAAGRAIRTGWMLAGVTCLVLVGVEIASGFVLDRMKPARPAPPDWVEAYGNEAWMREYEAEFRSAAKTAWEPYVYWRTQPFSGRTINVLADGRRRTWSDPAAGPSAPKVWVIGGSTVWGICARDDGTVPSWVARTLSERHHRPADVSNRGEFGYVSGQEVVLLERLLGDGGRPAAVVFYDGVNDEFSAYQNKQAGLPQNEANRRREFEARQRGFGQIVAEQVLTSRTNRLLQRLLKRSEEAEPRLEPALEASLARGVASAYFANVELAQALGRHYGFVPLFFWQPAIFDKRPLTPFEERCRERHAYLESLFKACGEAVRAHPVPAGARFFDLSGAFASEPAPLFADFCHLTEDGNRRIAEAIAKELDAALPR